MTYIIMTAEQAQSVSGVITPGWSLQPVQITDGSFVLPSNVLTRDHYQPMWETLSAFPTRDVADSEFLSSGELI